MWEEISDGYDQIKVGDREMNSRAYVSGFNFKGSDQQRTVGTLSGGERNRVHLAKLLRSGGNLLLLDEPTNDLDVDTLRALEEALLAFAGCAVVISHDRWFLDRIATHVLAFEGDSEVVWFEGNFEAYEENRRERLGAGRRPPAPDHVQEARRAARQRWTPSRYWPSASPARDWPVASGGPSGTRRPARPRTSPATPRCWRSPRDMPTSPESGYDEAVDGGDLVLAHIVRGAIHALAAGRPGALRPRADLERRRRAGSAARPPGPAAGRRARLHSDGRAR